MPTATSLIPHPSPASDTSHWDRHFSNGTDAMLRSPKTPRRSLQSPSQSRSPNEEQTGLPRLRQGCARMARFAHSHSFCLSAFCSGARTLATSLSLDIKNAALGVCGGQQMVGETGFEPATLWSQTRCATRLRYSPICCSKARRDTASWLDRMQTEILPNFCNFLEFSILLPTHKKSRSANRAAESLYGLSAKR